MKNSRHSIFTLIFLSVSLLGTCHVFAQSLLDKYQFDLGHGRFHQNAELNFTDQNLGRGNAGFRLQVGISNDVANVHIEIFRSIPPGVFTFDFRLDHIVVVFADSHERPLRTVTIKTVGADGNPFRIGDSANGFYATNLIEKGLPTSHYLILRFYGGYGGAL